MEIRSALIAAGQHIETNVHRAVLELGDAAVEPLLEVFRDDALAAVDAPGGGWAPVHAARLLGELVDPRAVPALLAEYLEGSQDSYIFNTATGALAKHGEAALEPLLQAYADGEPEARANIAALLPDLGIADERVYVALCDSLAEDPPILAHAMARYGDARALPMLYACFDDVETDGDGMSPKETGLALRELSHAIEELGGELGPARTEQLATARAWIEAHEKQQQEARQQEAEKRRNTVLSAAALGELRRFFTGQGATRSAWNARGFLTAVACSPSLTAPGAWLPVLVPPPPGRAGARAAEAAIRQVYGLFNPTLDALNAEDATVLCPPSDDGVAIREFCQGFMSAVALDEEWDRSVAGAPQVAVIEALSKPDDTAAPGHLAEGREAELDLCLNVLYEALAFARFGVAERIAQVSSPVSVGPKAGRNDPCPCGSGKKYKRCCGRPS